jgi:penicillin amidase
LPTLCWIFADREGHIGRQSSGWHPRRGGGYSGLTPIPAWDDRNHWQGRWSSELLPRIYDPPEGFVASANEDINPPGGPQFGTLAVPNYRWRRISERLAALPQAMIDDMQRLQYDVVSVQARDLLSVFLPAMAEGAIKDRLAAWDCSYPPASYEATLFSNLYRNVLLEIFGQEQGIGWRRMLYLTTRVGFSTMVLTCIDDLLAKSTSLWWQGRDKQQLIRSAAARLSSDPDVPWSVTNGFSFTSRFVEGGFVGRALGYSTGEMAMPGNHSTPFQGHLLKSSRRVVTFAPSYHFVTDLGCDEAWTNLPGGPSESPMSGLYKNDIDNWREGKYKRLTAIGEPGAG